MCFSFFEIQFWSQVNPFNWYQRKFKRKTMIALLRIKWTKQWMLLIKYETLLPNPIVFTILFFVFSRIESNKFDCRKSLRRLSTIYSTPFKIHVKLNDFNSIDWIKEKIKGWNRLFFGEVLCNWPLGCDLRCWIIWKKKLFFFVGNLFIGKLFGIRNSFHFWQKLITPAQYFVQQLDAATVWYGNGYINELKQCWTNDAINHKELTQIALIIQKIQTFPFNSQCTHLYIRKYRSKSRERDNTSN